MRHVLRHLRRAALLCVGEGPSDAQLLESFVLRRDEAAFEALLRRHGSMVLGVCRRVLRNPHDAEDAFQATFLVLARKAGSIRSKDIVAGWLYGVAYRTALKAQAMNAKRRMKEKQAHEIPRAESSVDEELLARLDHELSRLPDKYRVPVVLCELEGRTRKEVARLLAIPEGTLSWRLAHAKKLLGRRLSRYGTVAVSALLAESVASACLPPLLRVSTAKVALTAGAVPAHVLALTEGVIKAMLLSKLKITLCLGALMLAAGVGSTGLTYRVAAQGPRQEPALASRPQADELEALRLEIEALRKSLDATRARVKILEGEMRTRIKTERDTSQGMRDAMQGMRESMRHDADRRERRMDSPPEAPRSSPAPGGVTRGPRRVIPPRPVQPATPRPAAPPANQSADSNVRSLPTKPKGLASESLEHAEKALKQLRENLNDKEMIKVLERTLKELKEREKQQELEKARQQRALKQKQLKEREKRKKDLEKAKEPPAEGGAPNPQ